MWCSHDVRQHKYASTTRCSVNAPDPIRPLHDRVVLKRDERQRHSPGGILIPDTAGEKPTEDRATAFGKGKILESGKVHPWTSQDG